MRQIGILIRMALYQSSFRAAHAPVKLSLFFRHMQT